MVCAAGDRACAPAHHWSHARALALAAPSTSTLACTCPFAGVVGAFGVAAQLSQPVACFGCVPGAVFPPVLRGVGCQTGLLLAELQMVVGPRVVGWEGHKHAADVGTLGSCAVGWGLGCGLWGVKIPLQNPAVFLGATPLVQLHGIHCC